MFVIEVTPLIKNSKVDNLSYYSAKPYELGTLLEVPIRGKNYPGIVTSVKPVNESKTSLKSASFTLRKLPDQNNVTKLPDNIRLTAEKIAETTPALVGAILYQLLTPDVRLGNYRYPTVSSLIHHEDTAPQILTATKKDRYISYRSHIRSVLARRGSVMFVVPTSVDVEYAKQHLAQGIEDRLVIFNPTQNKKDRMAAYEAYEDTSIAKLIITTPSHAYQDRVDLLSVVVEQAASDFYRTVTRPYLDHKQCLIAFANVTGRSIILGDILPKTEDEYKRRQDIFNTHNEETKRLAFTSPLNIVEQKDKSTPEKPFSLFSKELKHRIESITAARGRAFLFSARRGLAPVVTCIDCGYIFRCPDSQTPYSLVETKNAYGEPERWFVSGTSGKKIKAADTCPTCGSWRLRTRGIGIQQTYEEAQNNWPDKKIFLLDYLTGSTKKKAEKIISDFYATKGSILVGTQIALPYLSSQGVDLSAVISLDATRANPTWRADENVFRLLLELREISHQEVIVQTRTGTDSILHNASLGTLEPFYNEEITLRESLNYPPFSTFVLLSWLGTKEQVKEVEAMVKNIVTGIEISFYNNPASTSEKTLRHGLVRVPKSNNQLKDVMTKVKLLPPFIKIEIDPGRIV
jgi:primosomal protein N' (replication factor Y) (superfamily II helicase)